MVLMPWKLLLLLKVVACNWLHVIVNVELWNSPCHTWLRTLNADLHPLNHGLNSARRLAQDSERWRQLVETAMLQPGARSWWWWWWWWLWNVISTCVKLPLLLKLKLLLYLIQALVGLSRCDTVKQIVSKLPLFNSAQLQRKYYHILCTFCFTFAQFILFVYLVCRQIIGTIVKLIIFYTVPDNSDISALSVGQFVTQSVVFAANFKSEACLFISFDSIMLFSWQSL